MKRSDRLLYLGRNSEPEDRAGTGLHCALRLLQSGMCGVWLEEGQLEPANRFEQGEVVRG